MRLAGLNCLTAVERRIVEAARAGTPADARVVPGGLPDRGEVRVELIRFLACGGDDDCPVPPRGLEVHNAIILGNLDLTNRTLPGNLTFRNCRFYNRIDLQGASTRTVDFGGSQCAVLDARGLKISGDLKLNDGFRATGVVYLTRAEIGGDIQASGGKFEGLGEDQRCLECSGTKIGGLVLFNEDFTANGAVRIMSATIGGSLNCQGGRFLGRDDRWNALLCDRTTIGGNVLLSDSFLSRGAVRFAGATITSNLDCDGGRLEGWDKDGDGLICDRTKINGHVFLGDGFVAGGVVRLVGANISGVIHCQGGTFGCEVPGGSPNIGPDPWMALNLADASAKTLWIARSREGTPSPKPAPVFHGGLNLTNATIGLLADAVIATSCRRTLDRTAAGAGPTPTEMAVDGFVFNRFDKETDASTDARVAFLRLQRKIDLNTDFKSQPWMQMVKALREMGHEEAARDVAIERQRARRASGAFTRTAGHLHDLYGMAYGYGYQPTWLAWWAAGFAVICALLYWLADINGVMAPTDRMVLQDPRYAQCREQIPVRWTDCEELKLRSTVFNPLLYSLELAVPILGARQTRDWAPITMVACSQVSWIGTCERAAPVPNRAEKVQATPAYSLYGMWIAVLSAIENLGGWLAGLMFVAVASGLIKKD